MSRQTTPSEKCYRYTTHLRESNESHVVTKEKVLEYLGARHIQKDATVPSTSSCQRRQLGSVNLLRALPCHWSVGQEMQDGRNTIDSLASSGWDAEVAAATSNYGHVNDWWSAIMVLLHRPMTRCSVGRPTVLPTNITHPWDMGNNDRV